LKGKTEIHASSGDVLVKTLTGENLTVKSAYGNVSMEDVKAMVDIVSSTGDVMLNNITGDIKLESAYGNQQLTGITGNLTCRLSSGDIKVEKVNGNLGIASVYGSINTSDCKGDIKIVSSSGDVKGKNLEITNSLEITSVYGDVRMQLANKMDELSFDLKAANGGEVIVKKDGNKLKGEDGKLTIDKGKIRIKSTTQSGDQVFE